jgi:F0F1-type ATP synthase membrane subunit b/b'
MFNLLVGFMAGALVGVVIGARFSRNEEVEQRLEAAQTQLSSALAEMRTLLDETRGRAQGALATAADRAGQVVGRRQETTGETDGSAPPAESPAQA